MFSSKVIAAIGDHYQINFFFFKICIFQAVRDFTLKFLSAQLRTSLISNARMWRESVSNEEIRIRAADSVSVFWTPLVPGIVKKYRARARESSEKSRHSRGITVPDNVQPLVIELTCVYPIVVICESVVLTQHHNLLPDVEPNANLVMSWTGYGRLR